MWKFFFAGLVVCLFSVNIDAKAQHKKGIALAPGDTLPNVRLDQFFQEPGRVINFSDIKKKLIILDFWNVWCTSCIGAFSKMDSLQKKFSGEIQIMLVTTNSHQEVEKIFGRLNHKELNIPLITDDTVLCNFFPHQTVPHHVWLNSEGRVEYITYSHNTNERSIQDYLNGNKLYFSFKNEQSTLDFSRPIFADRNYDLSKHVRYYSYGTGWIPEIGEGVKMRFLDSSRDIVGIRFINVDLLNIYQTAFGGFDGGIFNDPGRVIICSSRPEILNTPRYPMDIDSWNSKRLACYEITVKLSQKDQIFNLMQTEVNRFFDYSVGVEKRNAKCLVLVRTSSEDKLKSIKSQRKIVKTDYRLIVENETISKGLLPQLKRAYRDQGVAIIDETGYADKIDIVINCQLSNLASLQKELSRYNLGLIEAERELEMLVIKDKTTRR